MSNKHFLAGITLGAVIGAGLAYMFGTDQGKKLQKDIKKKGKEIAKNIPENIDQLNEIKEDFVDNLGDQAKEALDAVKDTVSEATDSLKEHFTQEESPRPKPRYFKKSS